MQIAKVLGDLTATQKHVSHEGQKLLLVQPLDLDGTPRGNPVVAVDAVQAGIGDRVLLVQDGYAAMTAVGRPNSPIDFGVIGVIDEVELLPGQVDNAGLAAGGAGGSGGSLAPATRKGNKKRRA